MNRSLASLFEDLLSAPTQVAASGVELGRSREDRSILGYRFGSGRLKISLIAGCHADEPVGPLFLDRFASHLSRAPEDSAVLTRFQWWIVPHINPDGAARNRTWSANAGADYDLHEYLRHVVREPPGDDIEFGFPRSDTDRGARPENWAVYDWWKTDADPFALHVSLHGMAFAGGPWFLIDPDWVNRCSIIKQQCSDAVRRLGRKLHDVQRHGEKGFERIDRGFCTRPNSNAMARFFLDRDDPDTAALFRPSSMETIRSYGGDALTLVSEVPLFVVPGIGDTIEPRDPVADAWHERVNSWKQRFEHGETAVQTSRTDNPNNSLAGEIASAGVKPVPIREHMYLQWVFISAGVEQFLASSSN